MDTALAGMTIFFVAVNLGAFLVMMVDKIKSRHDNAERISEGMMFFMAAAFASLGVYAGMFAFRHKTRKWYFLVGIPLLILENASLLYVIYQYIGVGSLY